ncbi:hypothetical protein HII36_40340 [Nonomuraea sp. NN258]|uniref:hypothetical protein n=1 Tax=Nonomuraea antri TaxID=2730852 RepID=UPI001568FFE0|nr:hypothetical protein [Nonomuraea antri]NRQ38036.1 hypothetical protein [Nonomuraea antri]
MRTFAALLAAAGLALGPAPATPSQAHADVHPSRHSLVHPARYVSLVECAGARPCGPWRLRLHDGTVLRLPDAQVHPLSRTGKPQRKYGAPVALSGEQAVTMLDWTANRQLTLHVEERLLKRLAILRLDLGTSRFTVRDRYTVDHRAWGFEACGG